MVNLLHVVVILKQIQSSLEILDVIDFWLIYWVFEVFLYFLQLRYTTSFQHT